MARFPFRNIWLKFLSVCIAVLLWLVIAGERVVERVLRVPVEFQNLPTVMELVGNPPETVDVRVRGSSGLLSRMGPGEMSAVLDLRNVRPGRRLLQLTPNQVNAPYGIEVVQVSPATVAMEFEMAGVRVVPVTADLEGTPAPGFEVVSVTVDPPTVDVAGPEGALRRLKSAVTEPVSVAGQSRPLRVVVNVGVGDASVRLRSVQSATVTVTIAAVKR
jgi:YbbR domain-containing protein